MDMCNKFNYKTVHGITGGEFSIWQSKKGSIHIQMGGNYTELTLRQIEDLNINVYELMDFEPGAYHKYYGI